MDGGLQIGASTGGSGLYVPLLLSRLASKLQSNRYSYVMLPCTYEIERVGSQSERGGGVRWKATTEASRQIQSKSTYTSKAMTSGCTIISLRTLNRPRAERRAHHQPTARISVFWPAGLSSLLPLRERARPRKWLVVGRQKRQHNRYCSSQLLVLG